MHVCACVGVGTCVHVPMRMHDKVRGRFTEPQGSPVSAPSAGFQIQVNMPSFGTQTRARDSGLVQHVFSASSQREAPLCLFPGKGRGSILSRFHLILPFPLSFCPPSEVSPYVSGPSSPSATSELAYLSLFSVSPFPQDPCPLKSTPGSPGSKPISLHFHNHKSCLYSPPWPCPAYLLPSIVVKTLVWLANIALMSINFHLPQITLMWLLPHYLQELLLAVIFLHYFLLCHHHALRIHPCTRYIFDVLILCVAVPLESLLLCLYYRTFLRYSLYLSSRTSHVFFLHPPFSEP